MTTLQSKSASIGESTGSSAETRKTRGIRFSDSEWQEVRAAAERRGLPTSEFVRMACLDASRAGNVGDSQPGTADLAPLVERTFRYAYILATLKRDELVNDGRDRELQRLVSAARELQDQLQGSARQ